MAPPLADIFGGGALAGGPVGKMRQGRFDARDHRAEFPFRDHRLEIALNLPVCGSVENRLTKPVRVGMREIELGELLGVLVEEPGMVEHGEQYQRFARRERRAGTAHDGAGG